MMIKKEDHNTGFSNEKLIKNFKNDALSGYLIKSIKKYIIKNFIKNLNTNKQRN